jgi:hypothetical protein
MCSRDHPYLATEGAFNGYGIAISIGNINVTRKIVICCEVRTGTGGAISLYYTCCRVDFANCIAGIVGHPNHSAVERYASGVRLYGNSSNDLAFGAGSCIYFRD